MKFTSKIGMLLLGAWLVMSGLISLLSLTFTGQSTLMGILAIAAGAAILLDK